MRRLFTAVLLLFCGPVLACSLGPPHPERPIDLQFYSAVVNGNLAVARRALAHGASVNFQAEPWGLTALIIAARAPVGMTRFLVAHGADVNLADAEGMTPLMEASYRGNLPVIRYLLAHHARVDARGPKDKTAIYFAIVTARPKVVSLLLSHHADTNLADDFGATPLSLAQRELAAARAISPAEERATMQMGMHGEDSMIMRTKAETVHNARLVLTRLQRAGARLGQQPARRLSLVDSCRFDEAPALAVNAPAGAHPSSSRPVRSPSS